MGTGEFETDQPMQCSFRMSECPKFSFSGGVVRVRVQGALRIHLEAQAASPVVFLDKTLRWSLDLPVARPAQPSATDPDAFLRLDDLCSDGSWNCLAGDEILSRVFFELIETFSEDLLMVDLYDLPPLFVRSSRMFKFPRSNRMPGYSSGAALGKESTSVAGPLARPCSTGSSTI